MPRNAGGDSSYFPFPSQLFRSTSDSFKRALLTARRFGATVRGGELGGETKLRFGKQRFATSPATPSWGSRMRGREQACQVQASRGVPGNISLPQADGRLSSEPPSGLLPLAGYRTARLARGPGGVSSQAWCRWRRGPGCCMTNFGSGRNYLVCS